MRDNWLALIIFGAGVLAGVALIAMLPGMPWAIAMRDVPSGAESMSILDLAAQRSMAMAAWWMVGITGASSVVGAAGLFLIFHTLREARRSADAAHATVETAREIGVAQTRAYITVVKARLKIYEDGLGAYCDLEVLNSGQSPALQLETRGTLRATVWGQRTDDEVWSCESDLPHSDVPAGSTNETGLMFVKDLEEMGTLSALRETIPYLTFGLAIFVSYTDVFGIRRSDAFKFSIHAPGDKDFSDLVPMGFDWRR